MIKTLIIILLFTLSGISQDTTLVFNNIKYNLELVQEIDTVKLFRGDNISLSITKGYKEGLIYGINNYIIKGDSVIHQDNLLKTEYVCFPQEENVFITSQEPYLLINYYIISDYELYQILGNKTEIRNLNLMNSISSIYEKEFKIPIRFNYMGQKVIKKPYNDPFIKEGFAYYNLSEILYKSTNYYLSLKDVPQVDLVIIFTGKKTKDGTNGTSYYLTVGDKKHGRLVNKKLNNSFYETVLLAHEIGHTLGLHHSYYGYIMNPSLGNFYRFSKKSQLQFEYHLANNKYASVYKAR